MSERINVALIGAGRTGTPLLEELLKYSYINIVGIADLNPRSEGIRVAREKGIHTTSNPFSLFNKGEEIDILIEVTGDIAMQEKIKAFLEESRNTKTIVMHDLIARLFISVCTQQPSLVQHTPASHWKR